MSRIPLVLSQGFTGPERAFVAPAMAKDHIGNQMGHLLEARMVVIIAGGRRTRANTQLSVHACLLALVYASQWSYEASTIIFSMLQTDKELEAQRF